MGRGEYAVCAVMPVTAIVTGFSAGNKEGLYDTWIIYTIRHLLTKAATRTDASSFSDVKQLNSVSFPDHPEWETPIC